MTRICTALAVLSIIAAGAAADKTIETSAVKHPNGKAAQERQFFRDAEDRAVLHGALTEWDDKGVKRLEEHWADGVRQGASASWYADGSKRHEGSYRDGQPDSTWTWYYPGGQKRREEQRADGKLDGKVTAWFTDGTKGIEQQWKAGKPNGRFLSWYANGSKEYEAAWTDGRQVGICVSYDRQGARIREEEFRDDGIKVRTLYAPDGTITGQSAYDGYLSWGMESKAWDIHYEGGKPRWKQLFRDGRPYPIAGIRTLFLDEPAFVTESWGEYLVITNVTVQAASDTEATVRFDISWRNSWRNDVNHDAAWVFFKLREANGTEWRHVRIKGAGTNPAGSSAGQGTPVELIVPPDRMGVFVQRAQKGEGPVTVEGIQVAWDRATSGLKKDSPVSVRGFGIEMVYVAEGPFYVGSGGTPSSSSGKQACNEEWYSFTDGAWTGGTTIPYRVTSEAAIPIAPKAGCLLSTGPGTVTVVRKGVPQPTTLPAAYPKGYAPFYCMKYELTQGHYTDFLNTLTRVQQEANVLTFQANAPSIDANDQEEKDLQIIPTTVPRAPAAATFTCAAPQLSTHIRWPFMTAFSDWAGLRPMSELEFEKACRGPLDPVPNEYVWGSDVIEGMWAEGGLQGEYGSGTEWYLFGNSSIDGHGNPMKPVRVGVFAQPGRGRQGSGATYWRIMNMGDNILEPVVNVLATGFSGLHGNGALTEPGAADVDGWPTGTRGWGERGGSYGGGGGHTSTRYTAQPVMKWEYARACGRCVRTAP